MSKRSYSDEEKAAALLALQANGGNLSCTSRATGVPISTLVTWRNEPKPWIADIRKENRPSLAERFEQIAHLALDLLPGKMEASTSRDLGVVAAIAVDKARLLREQPTTITRTEANTDAERADRILELLGSGGESGTRPPPLAQPPTLQ